MRLTAHQKYDQIIAERVR